MPHRLYQLKTFSVIGNYGLVDSAMDLLDQWRQLKTLSMLIVIYIMRKEIYITIYYVPVNCWVAVLIVCCQIHDLVVYPTESCSSEMFV